MLAPGTAQEYTKSLGAAAGLNYKTGEPFAAFVKAQTKDRGVDLILDCVGGSYWEQNVDAYALAPHLTGVSGRHCRSITSRANHRLALDGRWIVYGLMGGNAVNGPLLGLLQRKRGSLLLTTLRNRSDDYKVRPRTGRCYGVVMCLAMDPLFGRCGLCYVAQSMKSASLTALFVCAEFR